METASRSWWDTGTPLSAWTCCTFLQSEEDLSLDPISQLSGYWICRTCSLQGCGVCVDPSDVEEESSALLWISLVTHKTAQVLFHTHTHMHTITAVCLSCWCQKERAVIQTIRSQQGCGITSQSHVKQKSVTAYRQQLCVCCPPCWKTDGELVHKERHTLSR